MKLATMSPITRAAIAAACLTACGDPLITAQNRGDAVFGLHGRVTSVNGGALPDDYVVGVLFLRSLEHTEDFTLTTETEVVLGTLEGDFPSQFHVELTQAPAVFPFDVSIQYVGSSDGVFWPTFSPAGVRIGQLVIGPAAELAALPSHIEGDFERTTGKALAPYLPNTTVTPYQVIYAEGVEPGDVIYPTYVPINHIEGGMPITDGFTLVDARTFFNAVIWMECSIPVISRYLETPELQACYEANPDRIACYVECASTGMDTPDNCTRTCAAEFPDQLDSFECQRRVAGAELDATCGPERTPDRRDLRILDPEDPLSVTLGKDDIKDGLWLMHVSYADPQ